MATGDNATEDLDAMVWELDGHDRMIGRRVFHTRGLTHITAISGAQPTLPLVGSFWPTEVGLSSAPARPWSEAVLKMFQLRKYSVREETGIKTDFVVTAAYDSGANIQVLDGGLRVPVVTEYTVQEIRQQEFSIEPDGTGPRVRIPGGEPANISNTGIRIELDGAKWTTSMQFVDRINKEPFLNYEKGTVLYRGYDPELISGTIGGRSIGNSARKGISRFVLDFLERPGGHVAERQILQGVEDPKPGEPFNPPQFDLFNLYVELDFDAIFNGSGFSVPMA